jgi:hypothetical protein
VLPQRIYLLTILPHLPLLLLLLLLLLSTAAGSL